MPSPESVHVVIQIDADGFEKVIGVAHSIESVQSVIVASQNLREDAYRVEHDIDDDDFDLEDLTVVTYASEEHAVVS